MIEDGLEIESADEPLNEEPKKKFGEKKQRGRLLIPFENDPEAEKKIATHAVRLWEAQKTVMARHRAQWRVNAARRMGISNAKVRFDVDQHWTAWYPKNASPDNIPDVNKAAADCRRLTSIVFADTFVPEVVVPENDDTDEASAELSQRILHDIQGPHHLDSSSKSREAYDRSHTFGSGYERFWVDSRGGGSRPVTVQGRRDALAADFALINPLTGAKEPEPDPDGGEPRYHTRYVKENGELSDNPNDPDVAVEWLPALKSEVLDGRHVQLIPHTCRGIEEAHGAQIATMTTWGELRQMMPEVDQLPDEVKQDMLGYRPTFAEDIIPGGKARDVRVTKGVKDEALVFVLTTYYRMGAPGYPDGLYLITAGDQFVIHRSEWFEVTQEGEKRPLDIPLAQYGCYREGRDGYAHVGTMEILGGGHENRAAQIAGLLDHLDKMNRRKVFLPLNSAIKPEELANPRKTVLGMNPGGQPFYEDVPAWSNDSYNMYTMMAEAMESAVGLDAAGNVPDSKSGRHAFAQITTTHAALSEVRQAVEAGFVRSSRIALQLVRAFFRKEQRLQWADESDKFRERAWTGTDLVGDADIRIMPGTGTMLAPAAKAQLAEKLFSLGLLNQDELREIISSGVGGMVGLQDSPHRVRIRNQLAEWAEGPPEGWRPPPMGTVVPGLPDPMTGVPGPPQITDPVLAQIWEPTPADTYAPVAQIRLDEIVKFMATAKYTKKPQPWRQPLDLEYSKMGQALAMGQAQGGTAPDAAGIGEQPNAEAINDLQEDAVREGVPEELVQA